MGRRENPVDHTAPRCGRLAEHLRQHRRRAGLTYRELAQCTGLSQATTKRVASGKTLPGPAVTDAYVSGCGGGEDDVQRARELWIWARIEQRGRLDTLRAPRPELISDAGDLSRVPEVLWERAGAPSPRQMRHERPDIRWALSASSVYRIVGRQALPVDAAQLRAFLLGCGVPEDQHAPWVEALEKIKRRSSSSDPSEVVHVASVGLGKTLEAGFVAAAAVKDFRPPGELEDPQASDQAPSRTGRAGRSCWRGCA